MPEFYLDDDWNVVKAPMSMQDISQWANLYQKRYFPDVMPPVTITINTHPDFGGAACFDSTEMMIHIAERITPLENMTKIALLHEMIHVKLHTEGTDDGREEHGTRFKAEVKRLMQAGAYDDLL